MAQAFSIEYYYISNNMILGSAVENTAPFLGGIYWRSLAYPAWEAFAGTGLIAGLFAVFCKRFDSQKWFTRGLSDNLYNLKLHLYMLLKFVLVSVLGVSLCFLVSNFVIRRIPYSKRAL